ncbi:fas apoptotic inhibitory molecule 1-like [Octopus vulgaris]|uniref:Fas apoptotic inhibitory molecule 1-like n=2 Tax=Octopus TaxID=6643 RepID=A0AA36BKA8_OCTVU|nr:fas apoptotic inhibitory molecule 1-like [Octopus sinensis]XP_036366108.1 fas apoptotic inhibitory molecule 1-like [Octopus sinensis]XP_036366109.1 fas apoptotic inhibitory molecule 1-like [Octopus sinensis]XP_036366110.1 fas apoptotic inhibitory molecule 1-like [Octopus sinensis]XP_036366111.1 fas apoptotic inhibitory molecule 1-like [Octopus sinensis]CAI9735026.1 fas apoptotic inhibitory molecule 1-like [Octopus vulgaris]
MPSDLVGKWRVSLADGVHDLEFEHGTTSGKRVVRVDGKEIYRVDWLFKLVGGVQFNIGKTKCVINIDASNGFSYQYTLQVNGQDYENFMENQRKIMKSWIVNVAENPIRITLEKDTLEIWINGEKANTTAEFVDGGTETHFEICDHSAYIRASSSGNRRSGIVYTLFVDEQEIAPVSLDDT